jgi:hypothetical protein
MAEEIVFGRRVSKPLAPPPAPADTADVHNLDMQAEAFRATLAAERDSPPSEFKDWMRAQRTRRVLAWLATFALLTPGALCFIFKAPVAVSFGFEIGGGALNLWLRRERRRHLLEIARWDGAP